MGWITLPLPEDVGWAIIRYLQDGRPITECSNLFVRHVPPFDAFSDYTKFYGMMARLIAKACIPPEKRRGGAHSLRHSLATNLLKGQVDPTTISHILGHTDPKTAKYYFRMDIPDLRLCALDVGVACNE
jgi:integrase